MSKKNLTGLVRQSFFPGQCRQAVLFRGNTPLHDADKFSGLSALASKRSEGVLDKGMILLIQNLV